MTDWLDQVQWAPDGLVAAIAQEAQTGRVLTLAWMNREALARTADTGEAHYWSRSRRRLWRKGETSGHVQIVRAIRLDCDHDAILARVEQTRFLKRVESADAVSLPVVEKSGRDQCSIAVKLA